MPDTGTRPAVHATFSGSRSSGGVTSSDSGVAARAPLTSGLENESPAQALFPGASVTVTGVSAERLGSGPSCLPDASRKAAPG